MLMLIGVFCHEANFTKRTGGRGILQPANLDGAKVQKLTKLAKKKPRQNLPALTALQRNRGFSLTTWWRFRIPDNYRDKSPFLIGLEQAVADISRKPQLVQTHGKTKAESA